jgi:hypothetical protein
LKNNEVGKFGFEAVMAGVEVHSYQVLEGYARNQVVTIQDAIAFSMGRIKQGVNMKSESPMLRSLTARARSLHTCE